MVYEPKVSRRIHDTAVEQIGVRNVTTEHLVAHGPTPVRRSPTTPKALFALYQQWREAKPWLGEVLQAVWRPAVEDAWASHELWTETNREHVDAIMKADENGKAIPRRVQRRRPDAQSLFVSRKERDRQHAHVVRIADRVRLLDAKTLQAPGIGEIRLKEALPDGTDVRAVTLTERTPAAKTGRLQPEERTWVAHVSHRIERPLEVLPDGREVRSTGAWPPRRPDYRRASSSEHANAGRHATVRRRRRTRACNAERAATPQKKTARVKRHSDAYGAGTR